MKAGNAAMMADNGLQLESEMRNIVEMRREVSAQVAMLDEALRNDLSYRKVAD